MENLVFFVILGGIAVFIAGTVIYDRKNKNQRIPDGYMDSAYVAFGAIYSLLFVVLPYCVVISLISTTLNLGHNTQDGFFPESVLVQEETSENSKWYRVDADLAISGRGDLVPGVHYSVLSFTWPTGEKMRCVNSDNNFAYNESFCETEDGARYKVILLEDSLNFTNK